MCYHTINDMKCPYNALKGALLQQQIIINNNLNNYVFNQSELNIISKTLEVCKYFITKNQQMFQQPQDIIKELSIASNIISARQNIHKIKINNQILREHLRH